MNNPSIPENEILIEGIVVDESGNPQSGARVYSAFALVEGATLSGPDGRFRLALKHELPVTPPLLVQSDDLSLIGFTKTVPASMDVGGSKPCEETGGRIVLKAARTIAATVTTADGKPVSGASVEALGSRVSFPGAKTDEDGCATIRLHPEAEIQWIIALRDDLGFDYFENYRSWPAVLPDPPPETVSLTLHKPRRVCVRTIDTSDQPVSGVFISPWMLQIPGKLSYVNFSGTSLIGRRSDERGACDFAWLPAKVSGGIGFEQFVRGYHCPDQPRWDPEKPEEPVTFRLLKNGEVTGTVRYSDGRPAAGIAILGEGRGATNMYFRGSTKTRADGTYKLSIYPRQSTIVAVADRDWAAASRTGIQLGEGETLARVDFQLSRGTKIHGHVTVGPDERAATEEVVTLIELGAPLDAGARKHGHQRGNLVRWAQVDEEGNYEFRVGPGEFDLRLPNTNPNRDKVSVKVTDQEELVYNTTAARPDQMRITGRVVDADGRPVGQATVYGEPVGRSGYARLEARTDEEGKFTVNRFADTDEYGFYARVPDKDLAGCTIVPTSRTDVTLEVEPAATVVGYVYDTAGKPVANQKAIAIIGCNPEGCRGVNVSALTDKDGRYRIPGLAVDSPCSILIQHEGKSLPSVRVDLAKPGDVEARDTVLPSEGATPAETTGLATVETARPTTSSDQQETRAVDLTYTGTIRDETTDKPIPSATVVVRRMVLNPTAGTHREILEETRHITDGQGRYAFTIRKEHSSVRIHGVDRGIYIEIDAMHPGYVERKGCGYSLTMILNNEKLGERPFFEDFKLQPGEEVTGVVEAPDGAALAGVPVQSYFYNRGRARFGGFHEFQTDGEGRFRLTIPAPGGAVLWILPEDYAPIEVIVEDEAIEAQDQSRTEPPASGGPIILKRRGDLGGFTMKEGLTLRGQLLDEHGDPVAGQWVHACKVDSRRQRHRMLSGVGTTIDRYARTDVDGNVVFEPLPPGEYAVEPCEGDYTPFRGDYYKSTPIQGVFYSLNTTLNEGTAAKPFSLRAVPTVKIVAQHYDCAGKKTDGHQVMLHGRQHGRDDLWQTSGAPENGRVELLAPRGLEDATMVLITNEHSSLRFQESAGTPLQAGRELKLGALENDLTDVRIVRYVAPILLVKPTDAEGVPLESAQVTGRYADASIRKTVHFEEQKDGRHRSRQLLPDEECTISVTAPGRRPQSRTVSLVEGTTSELALELEPR